MTTGRNGLVNHFGIMYSLQILHKDAQRKGRSVGELYVPKLLKYAQVQEKKVSDLVHWARYSMCA